MDWSSDVCSSDLHDEIEHDEVATTFSNKAHELGFELAHKPIGPLRGAFGVQHSESQFSAVGEEAFLPESETRNTALVLMETLAAGPVRLELAARSERSDEHTFALQSLMRTSYAVLCLKQKTKKKV